MQISTNSSLTPPDAVTGSLLAGGYFAEIKMPGTLPVALSALVLLTAAVVASTLPAVRAARVDVNQALRSE
jgi:hypothetical protein